MPPEGELLKTFGERFRARIQRDSCEEQIIIGKRGHIFEDGARLGVFLALPTAKRWGFLRRRLQQAGFIPKQIAHTEGTLLFDGGDESQGRAALEAVRAKLRRVPSPEQLEQLNRARSLFNLKQNRGPEARGSVETAIPAC